MRTASVADIGDVRLASGRVLPDVHLAYETYGTLDKDGANAILICHALSGDAHVSGHGDPEGRQGWWDRMVGPGLTFDTDRFFVVCSNVLGGCSGSTGPGSPRPDDVPGPPGHDGEAAWGLQFPIITIEDMVDAQAKLLDSLGVDRLLAVVGGSMGGMQALSWAARHPGRVGNIVVIATTSRLGAQALAFNEVGRIAILEDPGFLDGDYAHTDRGPEVGLAIARMIGHITYLSDESMHQKFGRRLREGGAYAFDFVTEFEVQSYLAYQGRRFVERFDANTYLYMTKAMDYFDLKGRHATLAEALEHVKARFLILSFSSDWLFPTYQSRELVGALLASDREVAFAEIESPYGHDAFLLEPEEQDRYVRPFLAVALDIARDGAGSGRAAPAADGATRKSEVPS